MIKYEWREHLEPDESAQLADLLARAAGHDAEPEYSTIDFGDVEHAMRHPSPSVRHLVIWMLPHAVAMDLPEEPERIAGILRLKIDSDTTAAATIVVDPLYRSIGIVTLLVEQVGLDTESSGGWMGTGVRRVTAWARGNHPATGRLANRFLIPRTRRVWKLIRSADRIEDVSAAPALEPAEEATLADLSWADGSFRGSHTLALRERRCVLGVVALDLTPVESPEFGSCATIERTVTAPHTDSATRRRLLDGAAAAAYDAGFTGVITYVDSDDTTLVNACRLSGFQHDRTDVRYQLGHDR